MASSSKKRTTMAKLTRENKLRERRFDKQAKKNARKREPANQAAGAGEEAHAEGAEEAGSSSEQVVVDPSARGLGEA